MAGSPNNNDDHHHHDEFSVKDVASSTHDHYGIAFGLTILAGFATVLGALLVLLVALVGRQRRRLVCQQQRTQDPVKPTEASAAAAAAAAYSTYLMSGGLALAAGSIVYVAMADLLPQGIEFFVADAPTEQAGQHATLWTTLCFFGGAGFMALWTTVVHRIIIMPKQHNTTTTDETNIMAMSDTTSSEPKAADARVQAPDEENSLADGKVEEEGASSTNAIVGTTMTHQERTNLCHAGISTTIALVLHSLPEGLVTFIATAQDPTLGAALAIGIALHNVAEGMSIALPIYFAQQQQQQSNNSYTKALGASAIAGLAPVVGGVIGYALLQTDGGWSDTAFGILFGWAAGMLMYVAIKELLRTAYKYDPSDKLTTVAFFVGMAMIAVALVILESTGNHHHASLGDGHEVWDNSVMKEDPLEGDAHAHDNVSSAQDDHH